MSLSPDRIGNAPVSYGIWQPHADAATIQPRELLELLAGMGYSGSELGPPGYFGEPRAAADAFAQHQLTAIGAYVPLRFTTDDTEHQLAMVTETARTVAACNDDGMVILASATTPKLKLHPARRRHERHLGLDDEQWTAAAALVNEAMRIIADHGLAVTFHPHTCSYVESADDVDRLIDLTHVPITLDTGHARAAGDDPIACFLRWGAFVQHIHLKDVRLDAVDAARASATPFSMSTAAVPLGAGDVELERFLDVVRRSEYSGWVVVEQDNARPDAQATDEDVRQMTKEQADNYRWIAKHLETARNI